MNPDARITVLRREASRLEREMDAALAALEGLRDFEFIVSRDDLEEQLVATTPAFLPNHAIRG